MAATLHPSQTDPATNIHANVYRQSLMTNLDFRDSRYPTISSTQSRQSQRQSLTPSDPSNQRDSSLDQHNNTSYLWTADFIASVPSGQASSELQQQHQQHQHQQQPTNPSQGWASQGNQSNPSQQPSPRASLSYALPPGASRRVVERYSLDEREEDEEEAEAGSQQQPPVPSASARHTPGSAPAAAATAQAPRSRSGTPQPNVRPSDTQDPPPPSGNPRHPAIQAAAAGVDATSPPAGPSDNALLPPHAMPLPTSVNYTPAPVAPRNRAYPQQPTYINLPPPTLVNSMNTLQAPSPFNPPPAREEVCVECAMRDQEMADVDVTSPGVWDRESDAAYEELKQRETEEEAKGIISPDPNRPRARGGRLTEHNLRIWLSINPKEPTSKQQTLTKYVKAQRALLQAEAHAHAQAMQEARQLDNKVRDAYTQLRSSAYDLGNHAALADDLGGGVRIKPPQSNTPGISHSHTRSQSREITLLENGMIVEHVDVRKEEREARERRRKEERRARKSSRSSAVEVTSIISGNSNGFLTDNGGSSSLKPYSRYSQASSARPISILTSPNERTDLPRAYSQASFSDVHSLGSGSPRRRFFGFKNLSVGWRSQDSLTPSAMTGGSMIDMHVALQRESNRSTRYFSGTPVDLNSSRRSQLWTPIEPEPETVDTPIPTSKGKSESSSGGKKKKGLAKIWRIMTGQNKHNGPTHSDELSGPDKADDYLPLAPPPPLSYLVDRGTPEMAITGGRQQQHSPAVSVSSTLPKFGFGSPPTAPSSSLPSPVSSRPPGPGLDTVEIRVSSGDKLDESGGIRREEEGVRKNGETPKGIYPAASTPDIRQSMARSLSPLPPVPSSQTNSAQPVALTSRDKSLPPLPPGEDPAPAPTPVQVNDRPRTVYTYDPRPLPPGTGPAHDFLPPNAPFRTADMRRQSFNGLSSNPNSFVNGKSAIFNPRISFNPRYDEFGLSRRSLGRLDSLQDPTLSVPTRNQSPPAAPSAKRKSKFGLSALLGRRHHKSSQDMQHEKPAYTFPSTSDGPDEWGAGYATSNSRHSVFSLGAQAPPLAPNFQPRMSITSRKPLEELVSQDPEFVAYRYPSKDQNLDLFR